MPSCCGKSLNIGMQVFRIMLSAVVVPMVCVCCVQNFSTLIDRTDYHRNSNNNYLVLNSDNKKNASQGGTFLLTMKRSVETFSAQERHPHAKIRTYC